MAFAKDLLSIQGSSLKSGKIPIQILSEVDECMRDMAQCMIDVIQENNQNNRPTLMIVPVGPVMQYPYFVDMVNKNQISLHKVTFINMDEYMENESEMVSMDHPLSFRRFMKDHCYQKINPELCMPAANQIFPTPDNEEIINEVIAIHGGVDLCLGGIGINGHIAFNEPPQTDDFISEEEFLNSSVRVQKIAAETKVVNAISDLDGAYDLVPTYCITLGMKQIFASKVIRLYCFRNWHRAVIRKAAFGEKTMYFPVSLLQEHPSTLITIPEVLA